MVVCVRGFVAARFAHAPNAAHYHLPCLTPRRACRTAAPRLPPTAACRILCPALYHRTITHTPPLTRLPAGYTRRSSSIPVRSVLPADSVVHCAPLPRAVLLHCIAPPRVARCALYHLWCYRFFGLFAVGLVLLRFNAAAHRCTHAHAHCAPHTRAATHARTRTRRTAHTHALHAYFAVKLAPRQRRCAPTRIPRAHCARTHLRICALHTFCVPCGSGYRVTVAVWFTLFVLDVPAVYHAPVRTPRLDRFVPVYVTLRCTRCVHRLLHHVPVYVPLCRWFIDCSDCLDYCLFYVRSHTRLCHHMPPFHTFHTTCAPIPSRSIVVYYTCHFHCHTPHCI